MAAIGVGRSLVMAAMHWLPITHGAAILPAILGRMGEEMTLETALAEFQKHVFATDAGQCVRCRLTVCEPTTSFVDLWRATLATRGCALVLYKGRDNTLWCGLADSIRPRTLEVLEGAQFRMSNAGFKTATVEVGPAEYVSHFFVYDLAVAATYSTNPSVPRLRATGVIPTKEIDRTMMVATAHVGSRLITVAMPHSGSYNELKQALNKLGGIPGTARRLAHLGSRRITHAL